MSDPNHQPIVNPMPPVVIALFLFIAGIEAYFVLGTVGLIGDPSAIGWRLNAIQEYGLSPNVIHWMVDNNIYPIEHVKRLLTFSFVNGSTISAAVAIALLLALGRMVGSIFSAVSLLVVYFGSAVGGSVVFAYAAPQNEWLFGSYVGVYGLIGAYSYINWLVLRAEHAPQYRAFSLIVMLMGVQLLFGMFFSVGYTWIADLAAFAVGFVLSFLVAPGGIMRILRALRRD